MAETRVFVSIFGKHPGWAESVDDNAIVSEPVAALKHALWSEGIFRNLSNGSWERVPAADRLPAFSHEIFVRSGKDFLVGRMATARDQRGRVGPLVMVAHATGVDDAWMVENVCPLLSALQDKLITTNNSELARLAAGETRRAIEKMLDQRQAAGGAAEGGVGGGVGSGDRAILMRLANSRDMDDVPNPNTLERAPVLRRAMHILERELAGQIGGGEVLAKAGAGEGPSAGGDKSVQLRVTRGLAKPGDAARGWIAAARAMVAEIAGEGVEPGIVTVIIPDEAIAPTKFADVIVGPLKPSKLVCVLVGEGAMPRSTAVAHPMDAAFVTRSNDAIARWMKGEGRPVAKGTDVDEERTRERWVVPVLVGSVVLLAVAFVVGPKLMGSGGVKPSGSGTKPVEVSDGTKQPSGVKGGATSGADPRVGWDVEAKLEAARAGAGEVAAGVGAGSEVAKGANALIERAKVVSDQVREAKAVEWGRASESRVNADVGRLNAEAGAIEERLAELRKQAAEATTVAVRDAVKNAPVRSDALKRAFAKAMAAFVAGSGEKKPVTAAAVQDRAAKVGAVVSAIEEKVLAVLPPRPEAAVGEGRVAVIDEAEMQRAWEKHRAAVMGLAAEEAGVVIAESELKGLGPSVAAAEEIGARRAEELTEWSYSASEVWDQLAVLDDATARAFAYGVDYSNGKGVKQVVERAQLEPAYAAVSGAVVGPALEALRAQKLAEAEKAEPLYAVLDAAAGATTAEAGPSSIEVLTAWETLFRFPFPDSISDLRRAIAWMEGPVQRAARTAPEADRERALGVVRKRLLSMWKQLADGAKTNEQQDAVFALGDRVGVKGADDEALKNWSGFTRLNYRVWWLTCRQGANRADATIERVTSMIEDANNLRGEDQKKSVPTRESLERLASVLAEAAGAGELRIGSYGPGRVGWNVEKIEQDEKGRARVVAFVNGAERVVFERVSDDAQMAAGSASYVARTETPVGLFTRVLADDAVRAAVKPALWQYEASDPALTHDPREGPRSWEWNGGRVVIASSYLRVLPQAGTDDVNAAALRQAPDAASPVQYVGPVAAGAVSSALGCRLPTSGEWARAASAAPVVKANLRDASWARAASRAVLRAGEGVDAPGAGAFFVGGQRSDPMRDVAPAVTDDDGLVWFGAVGDGGAFANLLGNVAEWVCDDASVGEGFVGPAMEPSAGSGEQVGGGVGKALTGGMSPVEGAKRAMVGLSGQRVGFRVIGGSALSPASIDVSTSYENTWASSIGGYSDVGFRLAFTAPAAAGAKSAGERIAEALKGVTPVPLFVPPPVPAPKPAEKKAAETPKTQPKNEPAAVKPGMK